MSFAVLSSEAVMTCVSSGATCMSWMASSCTVVSCSSAPVCAQHTGHGCRGTGGRSGVRATLCKVEWGTGPEVQRASTRGMPLGQGGRGAACRRADPMVGIGCTRRSLENKERVGGRATAAAGERAARRLRSMC